MVNIRPDLEVCESDEDFLIGYQKIKCHLIFDVKLSENFRRKTRYVAGGHTTETPSTLTYSSVVSIDYVQNLSSQKRCLRNMIGKMPRKQFQRMSQNQGGNQSYPIVL